MLVRDSLVYRTVGQLEIWSDSFGMMIMWAAIFVVALVVIVMVDDKGYKS